MTEHSTEVVVDGLAFTEGPRWHDGRLWCSDQHDGRVLTIGPGGAIETVVEVPGSPSGLGWLPDGRLLVVSMRDRRLLRLDGTTLTEVADLSSLVPFDCNDMVVDAAGRAYVGNFGFDLFAGEPVAPTVLVRVDPDGTATVVADDLRFPNGTVVTPDGATLVVAETMGARLTAFSVGADGSLSDRRAWAALDGVSPDGCCLDAQGAIWVADPGGRRVLRVLEGGTVTDTVPIEAPSTAVACALGGPELRTLFVCTATEFVAERSVVARTGRIEAVDVDVPGAGSP